MLRHRVSRGLIIGRSGFSPKARLTTFALPGRPIRLLSGTGLAGSMAAMGLGVRVQGKRFVVDHAFFDTLGILSFAADLADFHGGRRPFLKTWVARRRRGSLGHGRFGPTTWLSLILIAIALVLVVRAMGGLQ